MLCKTLLVIFEVSFCSSSAVGPGDRLRNAHNLGGDMWRARKIIGIGSELQGKCAVWVGSWFKSPGVQPIQPSTLSGESSVGERPSMPGSLEPNRRGRRGTQGGQPQPKESHPTACTVTFHPYRGSTCAAASPKTHLKCEDKQSSKHKEPGLNDHCTDVRAQLVR
jgi:hypothetical protein